MAEPRLVVVINDSPELLAFIADVLREDEGYAVRTFRAEDATVEQVVREHPALIIIDLLVPTTGEGLTGWELLEQMLANAELSRLPFVVASAAIEALRQREAALKGHENVAVLLKPFSVAQLTAVADRLLGPR